MLWTNKPVSVVVQPLVLLLAVITAQHALLGEETSGGPIGLLPNSTTSSDQVTPSGLYVNHESENNTTANQTESLSGATQLPSQTSEHRMNTEKPPNNESSHSLPLDDDNTNFANDTHSQENGYSPHSTQLPDKPTAVTTADTEHLNDSQTSSVNSVITHHTQTTTPTVSPSEQKLVTTASSSAFDSKSPSWDHNSTISAATNVSTLPPVLNNTSSKALVTRIHIGATQTQRTVKTSAVTSSVSFKKTRTEENIPLCSSRSNLVSKCLIAIASLAGVATIFIICSIVLCTKLSTMKHRYRIEQAYYGTEMVCISALLPDGSGHTPRPKIPKSNGALIPNEDADNAGVDDVTLNSFLPENDPN